MEDRGTVPRLLQAAREAGEYYPPASLRAGDNAGRGAARPRFTSWGPPLTPVRGYRS